MPPKVTAERGKGSITNFFKPIQRPTAQAPQAPQGLKKSPPPISSKLMTSSPSRSQTPPPLTPMRPTPQTPQKSHRNASQASQEVRGSQDLSHWQQAPSASRRSSPSPPNSLINTPAKQTAYPRDRIIAASDDEDSDSSSSDGGFVDILAKYAPPQRESTRPSQNPFETPRAKRTMQMHNIHVSPLTINTRPRHRFDLKALARDARRDDATDASSARLQEVEAASKLQDPNFSFGGSNQFAEIIQNKSGKNAHKVIRAVQRTESECRLRFCFFELAQQTHPPSNVPNTLESQPWRALLNCSKKAREQFLISGLPYTIAQKTGGLPEEVFEWMLDELCIQQSGLLRQEYCNIASSSSDLVERLVTPERLEMMFIRLGASQEEFKKRDEEFQIFKPEEEPYSGHKWSNLRAFLLLLKQMSSSMSVLSLIFSAQTLLRMSLDKFLLCNTDILAVYEVTIKQILEAIPDASWNSFCLETSKLLCGNIRTQSIRINALLCLPICHKRTHELRRRLAVAFLYNDPQLGASHPDDVITIKALNSRLKMDDFQINTKTDFDEFRVSIIILDMVVDDGSFAPTGERADEDDFNAQIDELAVHLRGFWAKISDAGLKLTRAETKSVVEWVQQRISLSVRTRAKVKQDIYDRSAQEDAEDPFLPRQQNFLKNFLGKPVAN